VKKNNLIWKEYAMPKGKNTKAKDPIAELQILVDEADELRSKLEQKEEIIKQRRLSLIVSIAGEDDGILSKAVKEQKGRKNRKAAHSDNSTIDTHDAKNVVDNRDSINDAVTQTAVEGEEIFGDIEETDSAAKDAEQTDGVAKTEGANE